MTNFIMKFSYSAVWKLEEGKLFLCISLPWCCSSKAKKNKNVEGRIQAKATPWKLCPFLQRVKCSFLMKYHKRTRANLHSVSQRLIKNKGKCFGLLSIWFRFQLSRDKILFSLKNTFLTLTQIMMHLINSKKKKKTTKLLAYSKGWRKAISCF